MINADAFLLSKDLKILWNAMSWQEVALIHSKLFACHLKLQPQFYKSKLVILTHTLCEYIVNENTPVPDDIIDLKFFNLKDRSIVKHKN